MPTDPFNAELKILRQKDPKNHDEDSWPIFILRNAEVRAKDGSLASLLRANSEFKVTLTGELVVKESAKASILPGLKSRAHIPIQVKNCDYFAYGSYDNGDIVIWGAGAAGWHQLRPSEAYVEIFQDMCDAVGALYFLIDCYKSGEKLGYEEIFKNYAKIHHITAQAAAERFYSHADFLAARMRKGEDDIRWGQTSFYQHLRKEQPEAFGEQPKSAPPPAPINTRAAAVKVQTRETRSRSQSEDVRTKPPARRVGRSAEAEPNPNLKKPTGRPSKQAQTSLLSEANKAKAKEVWKFIQKKTNDTLPEVGEMTVETFGRFLFQEYNFYDEEEATRFLQYLAPDLVGMMSIPRGRSYDPWTELPIYDELLEAKLSPRIKAKIAVLELQKRDQPLYEVSDDTLMSDADSSEESVMDEREATIRRREEERRSLSSLRPKSNSKYSGKAAKRKGKSAKVIEDDEDEVMTDDTANEDVMAIDTPSKRKTPSEEEVGEEETLHPKKRFTRSQGDHDPELQDLEFKVQQARSTGLAIRRKASQSSASANPALQPHLALISKPVESLDANAPGDIWNCPHTGCIHKVYGASELDSKDLIRDHLLDHKEKERVDLIHSEESMTSLPVSNLLRRIREMAERSGGEEMRKLENGMMGLFPAPLERGIL